MTKINKINVCCQKVLPLVYDESLSYYEVLCKVVQKLNELIKINNNIRDEIHKEYIEILESAKAVTEAVASVTAMRDEVLTLKQATEQYASDVATAYNETLQARNTAVAKAESAEQSANVATQKADIASQSATTATTKANSAEQSANVATQKADSASQSATVATAQASEAQTSATNAKQYADQAKQAASLVGSDITQLKENVNNLNSTVSRNTYNISSLTTKVDSNTSQITTLSNTLLAYWNTLYPVGSIYISTNANFNPQTTWGGSWNRTAEGRCLIGANDAYPIGSMGGSATHTHATQGHTLTINEMPSHSHSFSKPPWTNAEYTAGSRYLSSYGSSSVSTVTTGTTNATGGGQAHSHGDTLSSSSMQPYLSVYIWERTA